MISELAVWEWCDNIASHSFSFYDFEWQEWYEVSMFVEFSGTSVLLLSTKLDISELSENSSGNCGLNVDVKGIYKLKTGNYTSPYMTWT